MRTQRQMNPTPTQWALVGLGTLAVVGLSAAGMRRGRRTSKATGEPKPTPTPPPVLPPPPQAPRIISLQTMQQIEELDHVFEEHMEAHKPVVLLMWCGDGEALRAAFAAAATRAPADALLAEGNIGILDGEGVPYTIEDCDGVYGAFIAGRLNGGRYEVMEDSGEEFIARQTTDPDALADLVVRWVSGHDVGVSPHTVDFLSSEGILVPMTEEPPLVTLDRDTNYSVPIAPRHPMTQITSSDPEVDVWEQFPDDFQEGPDRVGFRAQWPTTAVITITQPGTGSQQQALLRFV